MTEQEQKAFTTTREALRNLVKGAEKCVDDEWGPGEDQARIIPELTQAREALTAANAVSHPQATEPRTTEQIVLDMEVWFEAQEPMPDSMTAAKEFARRIRIQTEQDIAKVIQRRGWELMRSESGYFLRDAAAPEAHHGK